MYMRNNSSIHKSCVYVLPNLGILRLHYTILEFQKCVEISSLCINATQSRDCVCVYAVLKIIACIDVCAHTCISRQV